jgi:hypothetical protein
MSGEDDFRRKGACPSREPIRLRSRPVFDADCLRDAGFSPEDLALRHWPELWDRWLSAARADLVFLPPRALLFTELPACAEEETDAHFPAFPFLGYAHDVLARALCRDLLRAALEHFALETLRRDLPATPCRETGAGGLCPPLYQAQAAPGGTAACVPFPRLSPEERSVLVRLGILAPGRPYSMLLRRYAILTLRPPAQGCALCALSAACPKRPLS